MSKPTPPKAPKAAPSTLAACLGTALALACLPTAMAKSRHTPSHSSKAAEGATGTAPSAADVVSPARTPNADQLAPVFASKLVTNGVTVTSGGRMFLPVQPQKPGDPQLIEAVDGKPVPYPDATWNSWKEGEAPGERFVGLNAIRIGPDGALWIIDKGTQDLAKPPIPEAVRVIRFDTTTNKATRVYPLAAAVTPRSFVDDIRFHGRKIYITDAGQPGLIVLDLDSGLARRVLDGHPSVTAQKFLKAEGGRAVLDKKGKPVVMHADQLEVSPDGQWFYYQPPSGGLWRVETRYLDDPTLTTAQVAPHVEFFIDTPSSGGTAMDADGNIYYGDAEKMRVLKITPEKKVTTLVADPKKLVWVDAMWITDGGDLLMPSSQISRTPAFNNNKNELDQPVTTYRLAIGAKPLRN